VLGRHEYLAYQIAWRCDYRLHSGGSERDLKRGERAVLLEAINVDGLSLTEQDAFSMSQAAVLLDQARAKGDMKALAAALDHNLELWVGLRALVSRPEVRVSQNIQENLTKLANYVADATMSHGVEIPEKTLDTLINIDLQVSEGLLEGKLNFERKQLRSQ